ncbi:MAG: hypothetical protein ACTSRS_14840 [Candidatus Helarchaeota archaeon]
MWLDKLLDLEDLKEDMSSELTDKIFNALERKRLSPLEFTILETIFNAEKISTNDLILNLNRHFAGSFEAKASTIKPILSKLKRRGLLITKKVKSPLGPLKKVNYLTLEGEEILKVKVNKNFEEQLKYIENFLIELSLIYIKSFPSESGQEKLNELKNSLDHCLETVKHTVEIAILYEGKCPSCKTAIERRNTNYCPNCGVKLIVIAE